MKININLIKNNIKSFNKILNTSINSIVESPNNFGNSVIILNDKYILKAWENNVYPFFNKEIFCLETLKNDINIIPKLIYSDNSLEIIPYPFIITNKINGYNLNTVWDSLSNTNKEKMIEKICELVKKVTNINYGLNPNIFNRIENWSEWINEQFNLNLKVNINNKNISEQESKELINKYNGLSFSLKEQNIKVMYYDIHFGNFLINNNEITGMIDFERTEWVSIDYALNWINRMDKKPLEYGILNNNINLLNIFNKYYPELFDFNYLSKRLEIYELISNLRILGRKL